MEKGNKVFFVEENKNREGKGGKYMEKANIFFTEEKKIGEGKGGKYFEKANIFNPFHNPVYRFGPC